MGNDKPVCVVVGVGPGNGAALARCFAREGYRVALLARGHECTEPLAEAIGGKAYGCDVTHATSVAATFGAIRQELGDADTVIFNPGAGVWKTVEEITPEEFEQSWRVSALGALLVAQQVIPAMKRNHQGNILFVGATASRRGAARTAAFAPAKAAQRSLAESMARHLGPFGIHVALIIVDGVVDTPATRAMLPDKADGFFLHPDDVAETVLHLARQSPSAWTFELDVRPFAEVW
jgi:NAD(P)-dependent dehydrogenase (short-subunit alcohol dehydrogenase family)